MMEGVLMCNEIQQGMSMSIQLLSLDGHVLNVNFGDNVKDRILHDNKFTIKHTFPSSVKTVM